MSIGWLAAASLLMFTDSTRPVDVVVTAAPPMDAERLADALRIYLNEYGIRVETAPAAAGGDLRGQLADAERTGDAVRAVAVIRAEPGGAGSIEIELVDLATRKALIASVPRLQRQEDLYRALALKIQALLRSTLSEVPDSVPADSPAARLISARAQEPPASAPDPSRLSLEVGYLALSFPLAGLLMQGVSVTGAFAPRRWFDVTLGAAGTTSVSATGDDVVGTGTLLPLFVAARVRVDSTRFDLLMGPTVEVALARVQTSSVVTPVRSTRLLLAAAGLESEGRMRLSSRVWLYLRVAALGVVVGQRYTVEGQPILDTSRFELTAALGIGTGGL